MFSRPCIVIYPYNKNQQNVLFTLNLFRQLNSGSFEQVNCSSSWCLYWLAAGRIHSDPANSQSKEAHDNTNCCIYRVVPPDDEQ